MAADLPPPGPGWTVRPVAVVPLLGGPVVAAFLAPSLGTGADRLDVFLSMLALAAGIAGSLALLRTRAFGELDGWRLVTVAGLCLLGGLALSAFLEMAAFTTQPETPTPAGTPVDLLLASVAAVVASWGPAGALLTAVVGAATGWWGIRRTGPG